MFPWLQRHPWAAAVPLLVILGGAGWSAFVHGRYLVVAGCVVVAIYFVLRAAASARDLRSRPR